MALASVWDLSLQCTSQLKKYWIFFIIAAFAPLYFYYRTYNQFSSSSSPSTSVTYENIENASQDNPMLITFLRNNVLNPPSGKKYNLTNPLKLDYSQFKQGIYLTEYFRDKINGTFIEAGAWDGETLSNTLILEKELNWTGLLIEPNPERYSLLLKKHRKTYSSNCCISLSTTPAKVDLSLEYISHIVGYYDTNDRHNSTKVTCFPLYSLMFGMNMTSLDLLSLDLESVEVKVLKTIPWDKVDIKALLIEVNHIPEGKEYLKKFMSERNYVLDKQLHIDYFFVKKT